MQKATAPSTRTLRSLSLLLRAALILTTVLAVAPLVAAARTSSGTVDVPATLAPPFRIDVGNTQFRFDTRGTSADLGDPTEIGTFFPTQVRGTVTTSDTVAVLAHHGGRTLAALLAVLALLRLQRVVLAARAGQPFKRRNTTDLRIAGLASLAITAVLYARDLAITASVTTGTAITVHPALIEPWPFVLTGVTALGIAEIFRHGADLDEFDQLAI